MRFLSVTMFALLFSFGCGGGSSSGGDDDVAVIDAPNQDIDAPPAGVSGLGQKCGANEPACPANASECVALGLAGGGASTSFCTPKCVTGGTAKGAANNQLQMINPAPDNATCQAANSTGLGMGVCGVILAFQPMDNPIVANKNYTGVDLGCVLTCGAGNACPAGMTANNDLGACICFPN